MRQVDVDDGPFNVVTFFEDGSYEYVRRMIPAEEAVDTAKAYCLGPAAKIGIVVRVIITDMLDFTVFEWKFGEGVVFPPRVAEG